MFIQRYGDRLSALTGFKRYVAAWFLGAGVALALPPVYALPLLFIGFSGFLFVLEGANSKKIAFWLGWWFGFGFFVTGLYWIGISLLVDPEKFLWLLPFSLFGLTGLFAIYSGLAGLIVYAVPVHGTKKALVLVLAWSLMEYARGHLFTGFPWNLMAYVWSFSGVMIQAASYIGAYGLSVVTVFVALLPVFWLRSRLWFGTGVVLILVALVLGTLRLAEPAPGKVGGVKLRLVQANIEQSLKWDIRARAQILGKYLSMTHAPGYEEVTHVIWPESAIPFYLEDSLLAELGRHVPKNGALITGILRKEDGKQGRQVWNSIQAVNDAGKIVAGYDKSKLVPFGEFVPLRSILPIDKITPGSLDFSRGSGPASLQLIGVPPFSPLVCYEAIFPELAVDKKHRPAWILNLTNDAWFGTSSGPYQHLEMVRMRAVEQGLPLVRAANTGISAVFDAYGREVASLALNREGVLDVALPEPCPNGTTYGRYLGDSALLLIYAILVLGIFKPENNNS